MTDEISPRAAMLGLIRGLPVARALWVAATLGIADLLADGPKDGPDLAGATGTHAGSLLRVLRALCSVGVFAQDPAGRFTLTPLGAMLQSGAADSTRAWATAILGGEHYQAWGALLHTVRTGETAFEHVFGQDVWSYRARHAEHAALFARHTRTAATRGEYRVIEAAPALIPGRDRDGGGAPGDLPRPSPGPSPTWSRPRRAAAAARRAGRPTGVHHAARAVPRERGHRTVESPASR